MNAAILLVAFILILLAGIFALSKSPASWVSLGLFYLGIAAVVLGAFVLPAFGIH